MHYPFGRDSMSKGSSDDNKRKSNQDWDDFQENEGSQFQSKVEQAKTIKQITINQNQEAKENLQNNTLTRNQIRERLLETQQRLQSLEFDVNDLKNRI